MKKVIDFIKKELMLVVSVAAAAVSLFITPPSAKLLKGIDWRTLGILLMMLCVLEGFKKENVLKPIVDLSSKLRRMSTLSLFLVFGVFFTSMFVTNDVSLIIFVPITILIFRRGNKEKYILPVLTMENIAAIRGSMLMPFGSPQNIFLFGQADVSAAHFMLHMLPLSALSAFLLVVFVLFLYRKDPKEEIETDNGADTANEYNAPKKAAYIIAFAAVVFTVVSRTAYWYIILAAVIFAVAVTDIKIFKKVDYVLLLTFLCFFVFSSSITSNEKIASFLKEAVAGREYWWSIGLSQIISNVPSTIVLYPFSKNFAGLIYGADTAGLCSIIGSLASVINYRIYIREYPGKGLKFIGVFTLISWIFFLLVVIPGMLLSNWPFY